MKYRRQLQPDIPTDAGNIFVITSYSIHYTKLYDDTIAAHSNKKRVIFLLLKRNAKNPAIANAFAACEETSYNFV